ncbi:MAG: TIGR03032 family protein [Reichenbachiella sp.]
MKAPFFYYSDNFSQILHDLKITIAYSTYQAGKLIMISSKNGENITKYAKNFKRPMGIAIDETSRKLALASKTHIDLFASSSKLAITYPEQAKKYDQLYIPQAKYYTGHLDTHEIEWSGGELWIVNTLFSCLCTMSGSDHFVPQWKPKFISDLAAEDRCHLNGLALQNGKPAFVSCFAESNEKEGWRAKSLESGMIIDIRTDEILLSGLSMPHSPTVDGNILYFLQSATGQVMSYDLETKELKELNRFKTFVRGLASIGDYLFIGASKIREESTAFGNLPVKAEDSFSGIIVINKKTEKQEAGLTYTDVIKEIFSLKILNDVISPAIMTERDEYYNRCIMVEGELDLWVSPKPKK